MLPYKNLSASKIAKWVLLPLRLFLGITFLYAGLQKLTDPQFLQSGAAGYIGNQVISFARVSPMRSFLLDVVVPHATAFGYLVAYGEIAIGLGVLFGFLLRPAAFFGLLLNVLFYLSATWRVFPYFYGADLVFAFCWVTMLLNGPLNTGLLTLDELLVPWLIQRVAPLRQKKLAYRLHILLGSAELAEVAISPSAQSQFSRNARDLHKQTRTSTRSQRETRRSFLKGTLVGSGTTAILYILSQYIVHLLHPQADTATSIPGTSGGGDVSGPPTPLPDTSQSSTGAGTKVGGSIAQVSAVANNSAVHFTLPLTGDPGILVRLDTGKFVAYDAICTHAGCPVDYDASSHLLLCPCHGAAYDPAKGGIVVQPPASIGLSSVPIQVDSATGVITLLSS